MMTIWRRGPSRCSRSGCGAPSPESAADTRLPSSSAILLAYGRAARMRSCARRSLAAATSFMARVIFCVDWTERIRRWMSRRVGIARYAALMISIISPLVSPPERGSPRTAGREELGLGVVDGLGERVAQDVGHL